MDDFVPGDIVTFTSPYNHRYTGEITRCEDKSCTFIVTKRELLEGAPRYGHMFQVGDEMTVSKRYLKHVRPRLSLNEVIMKKRRNASIRAALEDRTGLSAGPGTWANQVRAYSGNVLPPGAEGDFSNNRRENWVRNGRGWRLRQTAGRSRRRQTRRRTTRRR